MNVYEPLHHVRDARDHGSHALPYVHEYEHAGRCYGYGRGNADVHARARVHARIHAGGFLLRDCGHAGVCAGARENEDVRVRESLSW